MVTSPLDRRYVGKEVQTSYNSFFSKIVARFLMLFPSLVTTARLQDAQRTIFFMR